MDKEEKLNAYSHFIGFLAALLGTVLLLQKNGHKTDFATFSIFVYSITLISMFAVSTIYHAALGIGAKQRLRIADHINIYFLIAGTYTPVALITLMKGNGWTIFFTIWGIVALGTVLKLFFTGRYEILSLLLYLTMGWIIVFDFQNLAAHTTASGIHLLLLGGLFYTLGILFYAVRRIPYNHFIWHLFVLAGAASHWFYIYYDVV